MHILCVWREEITEGVRQLQVDPNAEANRLLTFLQKSLCTLTAFFPGIHHLQYSIAGRWERPGNKAASKRIWSHSQITSSEE